jgi:hypothetical protein
MVSRVLGVSQACWQDSGGKHRKYGIWLSFLTLLQARLQLYKYPKKNIGSRYDDSRSPYVYKCWKLERKPYPSSLHVTVKAIPTILERNVTIRPIHPTDLEVGKLTYEQLMDEYLARNEIVDPMMKSLLNLASKPQWRRTAGQRCKLPNKLMYKIDVGTK